MLKPNAEKIYYAMANQKLSVNELAEKSEVSKATIYKMRKGYLIREKYAGAIAEALGVKVEDIILPIDA